MMKQKLMSSCVRGLVVILHRMTQVLFSLQRSENWMEITSLIYAIVEENVETLVGSNTVMFRGFET